MALEKKSASKDTWLWCVPQYTSTLDSEQITTCFNSINYLTKDVWFTRFLIHNTLSEPIPHPCDDMSLPEDKQAKFASPQHKRNILDLLSTLISSITNCLKGSWTLPSPCLYNGVGFGSALNLYYATFSQHFWSKSSLLLNYEHFEHQSGHTRVGVGQGSEILKVNLLNTQVGGWVLSVFYIISNNAEQKRSLQWKTVHVT